MRREIAGLVAWLLISGAERPALAGGLSTVGSRFLANPTFGGAGPQSDDGFGFALASGDLDGDGVGDLAVGVPYDDGPLAAAVADSGSVYLYLGSSSGLPAVPASRLAQPAGAGLAPADIYGFALAVCDFDGDGDDDLAVGSPSDSVDGFLAGAVFVHPGRVGGPVYDGHLRITQNSQGIAEDAETGDYFGAALACGDFNGDGFADLAATAPGEDVIGVENAGWLLVVPGSVGGLDLASSRSYSQAGSGLPSEPEPFDELGWSLAAGDLDGDGRDELAIGVPGEDQNAGAAHVLFGSPSGPAPSGGLLLTDQGMGGLSEPEDRFGVPVGFADFDADGFDDLVVGIPDETFASAGGPIFQTGQVAMLYGAATIGGMTRIAYWAENNIFGAGTSEPDDAFGRSIATGDFDGDGFVDLALGHPGEEVELGQEGAVTEITGSGVGLTNVSRRRFVSGLEGAAGPPPALAPIRYFGFAAVAGDFDGDGNSDLAIGAPQEPITGLQGAGAVTILRGSLFSDGFESGWLTYWSYWPPQS